MQIKKENRFDWIDIGKGIAITLMVFGHSSLPVPIQNWIYSFHMPFFFFISGVLSRPFPVFTKENFISFTKKKSSSLLKPFVIYSIINILLYPFYGNMAITNYILQVAREGWGGLALWFIPVFFLSVLISKLCITTKRTAIVSCILLIIIAWLLSVNNLFLPWNLSTVPFACVYIILGYLTKDIIFKIASITNCLRISGIILLTFLVSFSIAYFFRLDMAWNVVNPIVLILIASLSGIIFLVSTSSTILKFNIISKITQYVGRHTYEVLGFSQAIILIINKISPQSGMVKYLLLFIILYIIFLVKDFTVDITKKKEN